WRRVLATNLDGTFLAIKHGVRAMRDAGGAIVVVGSASGIRPAAGATAYSTSKAAVSMLVRAAAKECREGKLPIRINVVSPAGVRTPMWRAMPFFQDLIRQHGSEDA
ncbi:MAG: SDR family NAD(P)-dependent oxidoreductase, partial [Anaerolineae bacterium]|nr:SDR family NAD(P)-dependent oxidoreductase [Anaerolineae bacterium]